MVKVTIYCNACEGYGYYDSSDMSSNKTIPCYECDGTGVREIIDSMCYNAVEAMQDYPDWIEIDTIKNYSSYIRGA